METLVWVAAAVMINAMCMAQLMRWQARRIRGWYITVPESLGVHARTSLAGLACVLVMLLATSVLPQLGTGTVGGFALAGFFVTYYLWLQRAAYRLTKTQHDRGRGVARRNVRDITQATFGLSFGLYAVLGGVLYLAWHLMR